MPIAQLRHPFPLALHLCSRFCPGTAGCTSKMHSPTDSLRLVFALDDASLLAKATFRWASTDASLASAASTTKQVGRGRGCQWGRGSYTINVWLPGLNN